MKVKIGVRSYSGDTKADVARAMFEDDYSVTQVSKAVPMAYSQAHSIRKGMVEVGGKPSKDYKLTKVKKAEAEVEHAVSHLLDANLNNARRRATARAIVGSSRETYHGVGRRAGKSAVRAAKAYVWKGECGNCGRPIEAKMVGGQNTFIHTAVDPTDYIREVQFCMAFPKFN